jgi:hypothetical protein
MTYKVLFQKVSQILNLVRRLGAEAEKAVPSVDFIVDRFDRTGIKGLGQYWENRGAFSVIENVGAVAMAGGFGSSVEATISGDIRTSYVKLLDDYYHAITASGVTAPLLSGGQLARYAARLTSDNFTISADFTITAAAFKEVITTTAWYASAIQAFGVASSFDTDELGGLVFSTIANHVYLVGSDDVIDLTGLRSFVASSNGANIALNTTEEYQRDYNWQAANSSTRRLVVGTNNLRLVISGDVARAYLNDTLLFEDSTGAFTKGRMIGMISLAAVGLLAGSIGITPPAVTSFKAWTEDTPEPSGDESGHGTYESGAINFIDGYHDEDGAYNPLAFEEES